MYFSFFKLHSWDKRSAVRRRRFIQRLLKKRIPRNLRMGNLRFADKNSRTENIAAG